MKEVILAQVLEARERRAMIQTRLIEKNNLPIISFSMNIPGPVKTSPLIMRAFKHGLDRLIEECEKEGIRLVDRIDIDEVTGPELISSVRSDANDIKKICIKIEEESKLGRLFDMDIIDTDNSKLERGIERSCIVCGKEGRYCSSRRVHTVSELQNAVRNVMVSFFVHEDKKRVSELASLALLKELDTTPKPGLVDRNNNGSHKDMDPSTFEKSIRSLSSYWEESFVLGSETAALSPEETFIKLRPLGIEAEQRMYEATGNVNTHKGAIFLLGTIAAAMGRLYDGVSIPNDIERIITECVAMSTSSLQADFSSMSGKTAGERLYLQYGLTGARGELLSGFESVIKHSLPALKRALSEGLDRNLAQDIALLELVALKNDTNMVSRGGIVLAREAGDRARALIDEDSVTIESVKKLDEYFIEHNLSPGGSADLLAVTIFLDSLETEE
ncbi:MAG: triphosphoribosyl-dephospho-CoA synthase CitG [Sphaerochaetaceae bacterium]|nr:triphosphoribosyl-dephospho-CoA synthase CitG [Sphaerochaetaceae bacterium]